MDEILCKECEHRINKHHMAGYGWAQGCHVYIDEGLACECEKTPQDIAAAALAEARKEVTELAELLVLYDTDQSCSYCGKKEWGIDLHDPDCVMAKAYRIKYNHPQNKPPAATLTENVSNAYMEGMQADLSQGSTPEWFNSVKEVNPDESL